MSSISNKSNKLQAEDTHLGLIKFKNGVVCQVSLTTALRPTDFQATIEVFQKENRQSFMGYVVTKLILIIIIQKKKDIKISRQFSKNVPTGYGLSHKKVFQNIINFDLKKISQTFKCNRNFKHSKTNSNDV